MILEGFAAIANPACLGLIIAGTVIGIIFGALPGLTSTMAIALCLPITYTLDTIEGLSLLMGLYIGGISGGLISAILLKIPGTPSSIATTFDGGPMAEKGEAGRALGIGVFYSFIGTMLSVAVLIFLAPTIAEWTIKFGPYEYFAIGVFSLTMVGSLVSGSVAKGLASCAIGLCVAQVGAAPLTSALRFTFGNHQLDSGFALLPVLIGLFAVTEVFLAAEEGISADKGNTRQYKMKGIGLSRREFKEQLGNMFRSAAIGIGIGILPGIGGGTSNMIAYMAAKNSSKEPEKFGTGCIDGIIASETSNNASIGGALIPLLTLGIPGDTATAMLLGALMIKGISTGPLLFKTNGVLVYSIFGAVIVATVAMLIFEYLGMRAFVKVLSVPRWILLSVVIALCCVGAYGTNSRMFDVWTVLFFGLIGYGLKKFGFSLSPMLLGFILETTIETNLMRGMQYSQGDFLPFITSPIAAVFWLITIVSVTLTVKKEKKRAGLKKAAA
ncbi:tripartite tricarboxylate transporter permease [Clostridium sp. AM58-1XD]|uniref:tripartite tricarboxylate transporter permease n=1 Tax=Clostridium sp. AM58-1XD TaxID=2292307 RepID=UPI000E4C6325|nr:tripartite tricarboxylate transporter permease [Clostridium sp. AM58-1XD]RGZ00395.1 Tat pathway signal protein [Clostridium sp. AM58-1XD]